MIRVLTLLLVTVMFAAGCKNPPKKTDEGASAAAPQAADSNAAPEIVTKDSGFDPVGSDSGKIAGLNTVYFEYDQARLSDSSRKQLQENADWIKKNSSVTVQIEGHTDERGSVEYNLSLGERRAKSVKTYLVSLGVDGKRLTIISYGEEKPIASGESESAWGKNRRANFVPLSQ